ncbi:MAG: beta-galactosidase, partial [Oscillospiraceae bacterium]
DTYLPDTTSYDYGAPLDECGDITRKYLLMRECLKKYTDIPNLELPKASLKMKYDTVKCNGAVGLFDSLDSISNKIESPCPYNMERLGQGYGYILYRTRVTGPRSKQHLALQDVHDRASVFGNGKLLGTVDRNCNEQLLLDVPKEGILLDVLVENLGRINYGTKLKDLKGITEGISLERQFLFNYDIYRLPMNHLDKLVFSTAKLYENPAFYRFEFVVKECMDTYIDMSQWKKGFVTVNGFNVGRYWDIGPQTNLFIPASLLKKGTNNVIVFEENHPCENLTFSV